LTFAEDCLAPKYKTRISHILNVRWPLFCTLVTLARVYALSAGAVRAGQPKGSSIPPADREKLGVHYAARAVAALVEAEAAGYFKVAGKVDEVKTSTDFEPLRSREDFKSLMGRV